MYIPKRFANDNATKSFELIRNYPFATVLTCHQTGPFISHLPLILEIEEDRMVLYGHLAKANPHADLLPRAQVSCLFMGPHAYITPTWYAQHDVPTWNYMTVHAHGIATMIEDEPGIVDCLKKLTDHMESPRAMPWSFSVPEDLQNGVLSKVIVGFKVEIETIEAKFKLSQNRSAEDFQGVIHGLTNQGDDMSRATAHSMQQIGRAVPQT